MSSLPEVVYTDLDSLVLLYKNGDLPAEQKAFPYYEKGKVQWVHQDGLARLTALTSAYPSANTQKGKK